jgi:hypothetical protein
MVVHHSGGLHVRIHDGSSDELEAAALEVLLISSDSLVLARYLLHGPPGILYGLAAGERQM